MTTRTGSDRYRRGVELAEAGCYEEGWQCLRDHLRENPQDAEALNDAGAILHCLGRAEDAIGLLTQAHRLQTQSVEIVWNLVEAYLAVGRAAEAAQFFDDLEAAGTLGIDVLNRTATRLLDQGNKGLALDVLLRSYRLWPGQEVLRPMLEAIRTQRPKVAFFRSGTGEDSVLADICKFVQQRFPTDFYEGHGAEGIDRLLRWSDIAWFDGGGEMLVAASRGDSSRSSLPPEVTGSCSPGSWPGHGGPRIVASLRRSDVRDRWVKDVRWEKVSVLAQIGSSAVAEELLPQTPDLRRRTRLVVVPNGVNLRRFPLRRRERGKHLACLGCLTMEANPGFLLQCMQKLHYLDAGYRLSFAGAFESPLLEQYVCHMVRTLDLADVVSFESHPGDLNAWLSDKHFIVAAGIGENQVEALLVGMACGLKPVVHNFPGADQLLPPPYLFNIAEQFCEQVRSGDYQPQQYRSLVEQRYPLEQQLQRVAGILNQLEAEIELQAAAAVGRGSAVVPDHAAEPVAATDRG
jgi:hypothetical protein